MWWAHPTAHVGTLKRIQVPAFCVDDILGGALETGQQAFKHWICSVWIPRSDGVRRHNFCLARISPRGDIFPLPWVKRNHSIFNSANSKRRLKSKFCVIIFWGGYVCTLLPAFSFKLVFSPFLLQCRSLLSGILSDHHCRDPEGDLRKIIKAFSSIKQLSCLKGSVTSCQENEFSTSQ